MIIINDTYNNNILHKGEFSLVSKTLAAFIS